MTKKIADAEDLMSALGLLVRRLRVEGPSSDLSWTERLVVSRLAKGGPATIAELARAEGMKPQSMGATVAALEAEGLVGREPHPTDGRQSLIVLTTRGAEVRDSIRDAKRAWLEQAIAQLGARERDTLFAAGEIIAKMVER
jgi:DNA-binding MarR family transcriptional regulator